MIHSWEILFLHSMLLENFYVLMRAYSCNFHEIRHLEFPSLKLQNTSIFFWLLLFRNLKTNVPPGVRINYEKPRMFMIVWVRSKASRSTIPEYVGETSTITVFSLRYSKSKPTLVFVTYFVISPLINLLFGYVTTSF